VNVGLLEKFAPYCFAGAAFEENVVGDNDRSVAMLFQDGENTVLGSRWLDGQAREVAGKRPEVANQDALEEVQLFVARACPEIVAMYNEGLFLFVAGFVDDGDAALLSEGRIGEHHLVFAVFAGERAFIITGMCFALMATRSCRC
jgi:hypothetical protein